jgi:hypothetical protein
MFFASYSTPQVTRLLLLSPSILSQFNHQRDNSFDRVGYTYTGPLTVFAGQRANPFQK